MNALELKDTTHFLKDFWDIHHGIIDKKQAIITILMTP